MLPSGQTSDRLKVGYAVATSGEQLPLAPGVPCSAQTPSHTLDFRDLPQISPIARTALTEPPCPHNPVFCVVLQPATFKIWVQPPGNTLSHGKEVVKDFPIKVHQKPTKMLIMSAQSSLSFKSIFTTRYNPVKVVCTALNSTVFRSARTFGSEALVWIATR